MVETIEFSTTAQITDLPKEVRKKYIYEKLGILDQESINDLNYMRENAAYPAPLEPLAPGEFNDWVSMITSLPFANFDGVDIETFATMYIAQEKVGNLVSSKELQKEMAALAGGVILPSLVPGLGQTTAYPRLALYLSKYPTRAKMIAAFIGGMAGSGPFTEGKLSDRALEAMGYGAMEATGEGIFQVLAKVFPFFKNLAQGNKREKIVKGAEEAQELITKEGGTLTAAKITDDPTIEFFESVAEGSFLGGGAIRQTGKETISKTQEALGKIFTKTFLESQDKNALEFETNIIRQFVNKVSQKNMDAIIKSFLTNGNEFYQTAVNKAYKDMDVAVRKAIGKKDIIDISKLKKIFKRAIKMNAGDIGDVAVKDLNRYVDGLADKVDFQTAKGIRSHFLSKTGAFATSSGTAPKWVNKIAGTLADATSTSMKDSLDAAVKASKLSKEEATKILDLYKSANAVFKQGKQTFNTKIVLQALDTNITKQGIDNSAKIFDNFFASGKKGRVRFFYDLLDDAVKKKIITKESAQKIVGDIQGAFIVKGLKAGGTFDPTTNTLNANLFRKFMAGWEGAGKDVIEEVFKDNYKLGINGKQILRNFEKYAKALELAQSRGIEGSKGKLFIALSQFSAAGSILTLDFLGGGGIETTGALGALAILGGPAALAKAFSRPSFVNGLLKVTKGEPGTSVYGRGVVQVITSLAKNGLIDPILAKDHLQEGVNQEIIKDWQFDSYLKELDLKGNEDIPENNLPEGNQLLNNLAESMIFDETKEAMPTTQDFEDSAEFETEINIPEANTEVMAKEIITPVSAATPFPGPAGMNVNPETLEKLEQVELPLFEANHGGIAELFKTKKPKQMVV
jgi:hypothetical protein